jgi:toxin ParE1/3/4
MTKLVVSRAARDDLAAISAYTLREWGDSRRRAYLHAIRGRFALLQRRPALGVSRDEIAPRSRSFPVGRHVIFYRTTEDAVVILRVLHQRMDIKLHLPLE